MGKGLGGRGKGKVERGGGGKVKGGWPIAFKEKFMWWWVGGMEGITERVLINQTFST